MENTVLSLPWLPPYAVSSGSPLLLDEAFDDFDAQAERLVHHDQRYLQLTHGRFHGRFISAIFGPDVALHVEICDQALLQDIGGAADCYTLAVTMNDEAGFVANGEPFGQCDLLILPPRGALTLRSPVMGGVAAIAIGREALLAHPALTPLMADRMGWMAAASARLLHAPDLAARLRNDVRRALGLAARPGNLGAGVIGQALLASVVSSLSFSAPQEGAMAVPPRLWLRYGAWRSARMGSTLSQKQVERAVTAVAGLGPKSLLRLERLHQTRRALRSAPKDALIGEVAETFGFSDWSRFSASYRQVFGERPIDTRRKAGFARQDPQLP
jgi:hypothetical protein